MFAYDKVLVENNVKNFIKEVNVDFNNGVDDKEVDYGQIG